MRRGGVVLVALAMAGTACGGDDDGAIDVFAAASLTDAFREIAAAFETAHPGAEVRLNTAGSSALATQIGDGAPADVFASANELQMDVAVETGRTLGSPAIFATNTLTIAVPRGNPAGITGLADLGDDSLLIGLCAPVVPCGSAAATVLEAAGVVAAPDTEEPDVRSLLAKVVAGDLDAGLVYVTDAATAGDDVETMEIPASVNVAVAYPIVAIADLDGGAENRPGRVASDSFIAFVLSDAAQRILASFGFGPA